MVRIKSLLKKADNKDYQIKLINNNEIRDILVKLLSLNNVLTNSYNEATLNYICDYLYDILSLFNKFYNNYNVLNETDESVKETYLAVSKLVYNVSHNLLNILAIDEVERM